LAKLAGDRDEKVRLAVAKNSYTPPEVLERLKKDIS
jgi:Leucine rich repeat variant